MSIDIEMNYETFEDALKSLDFKNVIQWIKEKEKTLEILFLPFVQRRKKGCSYLKDEFPFKMTDSGILTEDKELVGKTSFHFAVELRQQNKSLFEQMVRYVSNEKFEMVSTINLITPSRSLWELKDAKGRTVFEIAAGNDDVEAIDMLISLGANASDIRASLPEETDSLTNIMGFCVACSANTVFRKLLQDYGNCNTWDECGRRPIHIAVRYGNIEALQLLLEKDYLESAPGAVHELFDKDIFRTREDFSRVHSNSIFSTSDRETGASEDDHNSNSNSPEADSLPSESSQLENQMSEDTSVNAEDFPPQDENDFLTFQDLIRLETDIAEYETVAISDEEGDLIAASGDQMGTQSRKPQMPQQEYGSNLFHIAVQYKQYDVVHFLITCKYVARQIGQHRADGMTPLHIAAKNNDEKIIRLLVEEGGITTVVENDLFGTQPIHLACEYGATEAAQFLLKHGADANAKDENDFTPLHYACTKDENIPCAESLICCGANINSLSLEGETPLYTAISRWNLSIFWKLLEHGADPSIPHSDGTIVLGFIAINSMVELVRFVEFCRGKRFRRNIDFDTTVGEEGKSPLHIAVSKCAVNAVRSLIFAGASIFRVDNNGVTPFEEAVRMQTWDPNIHQEMILALLEGQPDITSDSFASSYPLHFACQMGFHKIIERLLDLGIDKNAIKNYKTPLYCSTRAFDIQGMRILLSRGADFKISDSDGITPLLVCAQEHFAEGIELLVKFGAVLSDANHKNENGMHLSGLKRSYKILKTLEYFGKTRGLSESINSDGDRPMHVHVKKGRIEGMKCLIRIGCDVNGLSRNDQTPLMEACEVGSIPLVRILLQAGCDVNFANKNGHTAMFFFSPDESTSVSILRLLLNNECSINHQDADGDTILHEAALGNYARIIRFLMKRGINVNIRNNAGETPLFMASKAGFPEAVQVLLSKISVESHANPKLRNNEGISPYEIARSMGHTEIMSLLLSAMNISLSKFAPVYEFKEPRAAEDPSPGALSETMREMCIVCQEVFKTGERVREFPCKHEFHDACILPWVGGEHMEKSKNCPVCKQPLGPHRV